MHGGRPCMVTSCGECKCTVRLRMVPLCTSFDLLLTIVEGNGFSLFCERLANRSVNQWRKETHDSSCSPLLTDLVTD